MGVKFHNFEAQESAETYVVHLQRSGVFLRTFYNLIWRIQLSLEDRR